jgi:hypothetical protein
MLPASIIGAAMILLCISWNAAVPPLAWSQVMEAIQHQGWIHGISTNPEGKSGQMWLSPTANMWAYSIGENRYFYDGTNRSKYEYVKSQHVIRILPLGEEDQTRVLSLSSLDNSKPNFTYLLGTAKVTHQRRIEVSENGTSWIEFELELMGARFNRAAMRVNPVTKLPVRLLFTSSKNHEDSITWTFDYPNSGPEDIYDMGVERGLQIEDLRLTDEAQRVVDAIAASRSQIGDFRLIVSTEGDKTGYVVWRKGNRWRVDRSSLWKVPNERWPSEHLSDDMDAKKWFDEQLQLVEPVPLYVCDGTNVWVNSSPTLNSQPTWSRPTHVGPADLMSGEGFGILSGAGFVKFASLLYPNLSRKSRSEEFVYEPNPSNYPGLVLIKRSDSLATEVPTVGHEWYYIDPSKGHLVAKTILFNLPSDELAAPELADRKTSIEIDDIQQSPSGAWYSRIIKERRAVSTGDGRSISGYQQEIRHYDLIFDSDLDDRLFATPVKE